MSQYQVKGNKKPDISTPIAYIISFIPIVIIVMGVCGIIFRENWQVFFGILFGSVLLMILSNIMFNWELGRKFTREGSVFIYEYHMPVNAMGDNSVKVYVKKGTVKEMRGAVLIRGDISEKEHLRKTRKLNYLKIKNLNAEDIKYIKGIIK